MQDQIINRIESGEVPVGEIVALNFKAAKIFEKYKIDFCCGGKVSLNQAAAPDEVELNELKEELKKSFVNNEATVFQQMSVNDLIDHIIKNYHAPLRENLPLIKTHLEKVVNAHGKNHPYVIDLLKEFSELEASMLSHTKREEEVLFRVINYLSDCNKFNEKPRNKGYKSVDYLLREYETEHEYAGLHLENIRKMTNDYMPPADACTTFRVAYQELEELEKDTHKHVHLENNLLFPKSVKLEKALFQ